MLKSPGIVMEKSGGMIRLRGLAWPLPVTLDSESKGRIKAIIYPNKWNKVPEEVFEFLKNRFDSPRTTSIPDVEANEARPHKPGEAPIMTEEEVDPQFYLEFRN